MSKKHHQRTRPEILAKRAQPIVETNRNSTTGLLVHTTRKPERSIYMPHIGAKEQERAKRCYMSPTFNCEDHLRSAPVMHQLARVTTYHEVVTDWE
jgi:hypothetical protein